MSGAGDRYVQPFVILGGSTPLALGLLSIIPGFGQALVQWLGANFVDRGGRRKATIVRCVILQALMWGPICLAIFLPQPGSYVLLLVAYALYVFLDSFCLPAWNSLMGDLVPAERRGWFFAYRNSLISLAIMGSFLAGGWWLTYCEKTPGLARWTLASKDFGFLTLFVIAGLARLVSGRYMNQMHEPPYVRAPSDDFSLLDFLRRAPRANFGRFVFYCALISLSGGVVGPFFGWYLLRQLGLEPREFAVIGTVQMLAALAAQPLWGRLADRAGNKRVLTIGGIGVIGIPVLLLLGSSFPYLLVVQAYDGIIWAAFDIAASNYFFDIVTPAKRVRCTAYHSLIVTTGTTLGVLIGVMIMQFVPDGAVIWGRTMEHPFTLVLMTAALLRVVPNVVLLRSFREWRLTAPVPAPILRPESRGEGPPV